jgi:hypothetical protein
MRSVSCELGAESVAPIASEALSVVRALSR